MRDRDERQDYWTNLFNNAYRIFIANGYSVREADRLAEQHANYHTASKFDKSEI